jgi:hypothetical protein
MSLAVDVEIESTDTVVRRCTQALIDCSATGCFIDIEWAKLNNIPTRPLTKPIPVCNVNGTANDAGAITDIADVILCYENHSERTQLAITRLGKQSLILGYNWLRNHNPEINWQTKDVKMSRCPLQCSTCRVEDKCDAKMWKSTTSQINACRSGAFPTMAEEDEDESPHVNADETDEEAQDMCLAFDDDLDSEVDDFTIEEDDCVFMAMVDPVDLHHFVRASSTVSGCLVEAFSKNSKPKGFKDIVLTSLHTYADVFSETAFDSLPKRRKWDHTIELERKPSLRFRKVYLMTLTRGSTGHWTHQTVQVTSWSPSLLHQEERWEAPLCPGLPSSECHHQEESVSAPTHRRPYPLAQGRALLYQARRPMGVQ